MVQFYSIWYIVYRKRALHKAKTARNLSKFSHNKGENVRHFASKITRRVTE